ncbi:MAG TPA: phosphoglycerate mutase family protein [Lysobacter sp.]|nr:phosphoglycerate mutase family protein [Lysobacter sp.]
MRRLLLAVMFVLAASAGCASRPVVEDGATYVVVRHAEKATDDPRDPSLSDDGRTRVERMVGRLHYEPLVAVYATGYRRSRQTAEPIARDHGLPLSSYDAAQPAGDFAASLRRQHPVGTVLVVAHSDTMAPIAQALCGCRIEATSDNEYGRRIAVTVLPDGRTTVDDRREP